MGRIRKAYTLFKRGDIWYYRTYDSEGYRTSARSTGCTSKTAAVQFCEQLHLRGSLNSSRITFAEYSKDFFAVDSLYVRDRTRALSMNTVNHYRLTLANKLLPYFGKMALCDINVIELKKYRLSLIDEGLKVSSIDGILAPLQAILKYAYLQDLISTNPFNKLQKLQNNDKEVIEPYTIEEIKKLCDTIVNYKNFLLLLTLTGMRASEAIGVTLEDFKTTEDGLLYIDLVRQYDTRQKKYTVCKHDSRRKIPVIPEVKELITSYIPYPTLYSALKETMEKLGMHKTRAFHAFRHFFISDTKSKDINPLKIEYVAGHKFKGIEAVYTHLNIKYMSELLEWQKEIFNFLKK